MAENIEELIRKLLSENTEIKERAYKVGIDENPQNYGINSFSFVKVIVALETEFEIEFDDEHLNIKRYETFQNIIDYVMEKVAQKS